MPGKARLEAEGFEEADSLMRQLELEVRGKELIRALKAGGRVVLRDARRTAPDGMQTGTSKKKSNKRAGEKDKRLKDGLKQKAVEYDGVTMVIAGADYNKAPHAHLVEDGHEEVLWGERTGGFVEGKGWFAASVDRTKDQQTAAVLASLRRSVERITRQRGAA